MKHKLVLANRRWILWNYKLVPAKPQVYPCEPQASPYALQVGPEAAGITYYPFPYPPAPHLATAQGGENLYLPVPEDLGLRHRQLAWLGAWSPCTQEGKKQC